MSTSRILLAVTLVVLCGCTSMYGTPSERRAKNSSSSTYMLCDYLITGTMAPNEVRNEWALELERRGEDCSVYRAELMQKRQNNEAMLQNGLEMMERSSSNYGNAYDAGSRSGVACFKEREWVSGLNKNCVYSCTGSETVMTIRSVEICPLTINR